MKRFVFSWKITVIGIVLVAGMLKASYWQWNRHLQKQEYINSLHQRLEQEPSPILDFSDVRDISSILHRRVVVSGSFDFENEVILRNRRFAGEPGVHLITPLKIDNSDARVLVNRGFVPLSDSKPESRKKYNTPQHVTFIGLIKESMKRRNLAPKDPQISADNLRVDAWLRVDIKNISKQLPYELLPYYLEVVESNDLTAVAEEIVATKSGREELLFLPLRSLDPNQDESILPNSFPVAVFNTVIPPGRHLGYVYEWAIMAAVTFLICLVLQLRGMRRLNKV